MRIALVTILAFALLCVATDYYIWRVLRKRYRSRVPAVTHLVIVALEYLTLITALILPRNSGSDGVLIAIMWMLFAAVSLILGKALFVIFDLIACIPCLWRHHRMKWLTRAGGVAGVALVAALWYGSLVERYEIQVRDVDVAMPGLPQCFEDMRIAQISDLHVGTYGSDTTFVAKLVDRINDLHPDMVVFTGDIVNRRSSEMHPFVTTLSRLKAPLGVYAILGNHDYGDYSTWPSDSAKRANMDRLYREYDATGWRLLRNETVWIVDGRDSLAVIGVENIGDPPFPTYGNLEKAYKNISDTLPKILLSHNPAHWVKDIANNDACNIPITLAGHTHAMQIELCGLSPAALRYPTWGGLYTDSLHRNNLYVNIGAGTVGMPSRVGATPEITLLTLKKH